MPGHLKEKGGLQLSCKGRLAVGSVCFCLRTQNFLGDGHPSLSSLYGLQALWDGDALKCMSGA